MTIGVDKMGFEEYFDLNAIFNGISWIIAEEKCGPTTGWAINFPYSSHLKNDILYLNAKENGKINQYEQFLEKYYYRKIEEITSSRSMSHIIHPILNLYEDEQGEKHLTFDLNVYITAFLMSKMITKPPKEAFNVDMSPSEKIQIYREVLRSERRILTDVLNKREGSEYYDQYRELYQEERLRYGEEYEGQQLTFENVLEGKLSFCQKMLMATRYLENAFEKEVDLEKLEECFNYDKLCLAICYSFLEQIHGEDNKISYVAHYCTNYFKSLEEYKKKNPHYNPKITIYDEETNQYKKVSAEELYEKYQSILQEYPNVRYVDFGEENIDLDELMEFVSNKSDGQELSKKEFTNLVRMFAFKQDFEDVSHEEIMQDIQDLNKKEEEAVDETEKNKIKQQIEKMEFLIENKPIRIIKGTGTFSNYHGYVYSNGYVVFDTLDKNFKKSYGNALYVIPYEKMATFSDIRKRELRSNYKGTITVVEHKGNWKEKLENILASNPRFEIEEEIEDSIDLSQIFSISQLEELKKVHADLTQKDLSKIERKKRHIEEMIGIDKELGETPNGELSSEEYYDEIDAAAESSEDFEELYKRWQKRHPGLKVKRNPVVAGKTKKRAKDKDGYFCCELCGARDYKAGSFDSHHVIPLNKGGIDNLYNTICVCPNCHRDIHSGRVTLAQQYELFRKIREHLIKDNPEYLPMFEKMISTVAETKEEYQEDPEAIDQKFAIMWNGENPKLK